jgi:indole-3-glycerol phosphate synthase
LDDLLLARSASNLPLLRKEFIVDEYQILEAKAYGADAILLIAACLDRNEIEQLSTFSKSLGLEVLLEVHNLAELNKSLMPSIDMLGVNNRDLTSFTVSLETSKSLAKEIPSEFVKISESGISEPVAVKELQEFGYQGFLMGEHFMRTQNPGEAANKFITELQQ